MRVNYFANLTYGFYEFLLPVSSVVMEILVLTRLFEVRWLSICAESCIVEQVFENR